MGNKQNNKHALKPLEQSQAAKRTNLAEWWANQFLELDLPSGLRVTVRDVDMEDLIAMGELPNTLISLLPELQGLEDEAAGLKLMGENPKAFAQLLDGIVKCCLVDPKIGEVSDGETTIAIKDMRGKDKMFLFNWANREAEKMRPFREGEDEPMETAHPG